MKCRLLILFIAIGFPSILFALLDNELVAQFIESPETARSEFAAGKLSGLGESISAAVYASLKKGQSEKALTLLSIGVEILPDDPHILGIQGVVAALAGEIETALVLLENAYVWNRENALVNYNLGNLLVQSGSVANWIRGKHLLLGVMDSDDADIIERAGLTLLVNQRIPLLPEETQTVHARLESLSVFRADNPGLSGEARELIRLRLAGAEEATNPVVENSDTASAEDLSLTMEEAKATDRFHELKPLALAAIEEGRPTEAYKALYYAFMAGVPFSLSELNQLLDLSREQGILVETVRIAEGLVKKSPDDPGLLNEYCYYRFLAGENAAQTLGSARELVAGAPMVPEFRTTLMLGLLVSKQEKEALKVLEEVPFDLTVPDTRIKLVYACVLAANEQSVVADGIRDSIPLEDLLPAELDLLEAF
ncbi:hypothetical protein G0Q06_03065 [Puniceicoccales bacterium CK1056]|uniref:Tetratricopeptide repeat protein n=1 Tax=Oceanipulchritudo coccoides TaxID=2706888 RepID=A0A6B2LYG3_9BACT|nr:hypothetical protein [Oceanipulchritudo coccoides]NDV61423.1 hypothetical protein [Oceanipulchritudo coccoides]